MAEGNGTRKGVANCGKINDKILGPASLGARRRRRQHASRPKGRPSPAVGVAANHRRRRPQPRRLIRGRRALHSSRSPSWAFLRGRGGPSLRIRRPVISSAMAAAPRPSSCPRRCARRPEHSGGHPSGALCPDSTRDSAPPQFGCRLLSSGDDCGGPFVPGWQRCTRGRVCFAPFPSRGVAAAAFPLGPSARKTLSSRQSLPSVRSPPLWPRDSNPYLALHHSPSTSRLSSSTASVCAPPASSSSQRPAVACRRPPNAPHSARPQSVFRRDVPTTCAPPRPTNPTCVLHGAWPAAHPAARPRK